MSSSVSTKPKQSPYVGYFKGNGTRTASRLFEPNSHPHVGVYRHAPAKTTSNGLQEILRDTRTSLKPKSVISTLQLFNIGSMPKHIEKKTLESMPTSHFISNNDQTGDTPMCPICLEHFVDGDEIRNLNCAHCFHKSCVDIWLLGTMSSDVTTTICPTCRQDASSAIAEPESGSGVYSSSRDVPDPSSTIPAECFLRVGQYLLQEGSKINSTSDSVSASSQPGTISSPVASVSPPLPPIASTRSPPLPPHNSIPPPLCQLQLPPPSLINKTKQLSSHGQSQRIQRQRSPDKSPTAAFILNHSGPSHTSSNSVSSRSSSNSISSQSSSSSEPPTMFFPALDDDISDEARGSFVTMTLSDTDDFVQE